MTKRSVKDIIKHEKRLRALGSEIMCQWDFEHDNGENPNATRSAKCFVEHFENFRSRGAGLFFFGGPGSGKSFAAAQIVNALTDKGYDCLFTSFLTIFTDLSTLSFESKRNYMNQIHEKDLVVFDDLGSEGDTNRNNEMIGHIVNNCRLRHIPMIFTSPFHLDVLKKSSSPQRILALSRILQLSTQVTLYEPGARRSRNRNHRVEAEAILNGKEIYTQPELPELTAAETAESDVQKKRMQEGLYEKSQKTAAQEGLPDESRQSLNEEKKNTED